MCTRIPWRSRTSVIAIPNIIFFPNPASVAKFWRIPPYRNSQIPLTLPESGTILWSNPGSPKTPSRPCLAILRLRDGMCRCCLEWHYGTVLGEGTRPRGPFLERPGLIYGAEIKYSNKNLSRHQNRPVNYRDFPETGPIFARNLVIANRREILSPEPTLLLSSG